MLAILHHLAKLAAGQQLQTVQSAYGCTSDLIVRFGQGLRPAATG
jgi:hypothetical protein